MAVGNGLQYLIRGTIVLYHFGKIRGKKFIKRNSFQVYQLLILFLRPFMKSKEMMTEPNLIKLLKYQVRTEQIS